MAKTQVDRERKWYLVDATDTVLGRLATRVADILRGKRKVIYTPHVDTGDFVIVVNAEKVAVTGKKQTQKIYRRYTGYQSGLREETFEKLRDRAPERIIKHAVVGMVPKNRLGRKMLTRLKVYKGAEHPHEAQQPEPVRIGK